MQTEIDSNGASCLVTGANGFVGSHLCEKLLLSDCQVSALVRKTSNITYLENMDINLRYGKLDDLDSLENVVGDVEYIFHVAGLTKAVSKEHFYRVNHAGTVNLLRAIDSKAKRFKKLIYVSSQAAVGPAPANDPWDENDYPNPVTAYGRSKLEAESEVKKYSGKIPFTIIRPPAVYGPRDTEILTFFKAASYGLKPYFGDGNSLISIVYIKDLVTGIYQSAFNRITNERTYFLTDGRIYDWEEIAEALSDVFGKKGFKLKIPIWVFLLSGTFSEYIFKLLRKTPMLTREKAYELTRANWGCSCQKAMDDFNYSPEIGFREGALLTAKWYNENKWL